MGGIFSQKSPSVTEEPTPEESEGVARKLAQERVKRMAAQKTLLSETEDNLTLLG